MFDRKEAAKHLGIGALQGAGQAIFGGALLLGGALVTWFISRGTGPGQPEMTRFEAVLLTVAFAFAGLLFLALLAWLYPRAKSIWLDDLRGATSTQKECPENPPPVTICFGGDGDWLESPFKKGDCGVHKDGHHVYSEDLEVSLTANRRMEDVSVEVAVRSYSDTKDRAVFHYKGAFSGTVTVGRRDSIHVFRRKFYFARLRLANDDRKSVTVTLPRRHDLEAKFFEGTDQELVASAEIWNVSVRVFHNGPPITANFSVDARDVQAPRTRVYVEQGIEPVRFSGVVSSPSFPNNEV